MSTTTTDIVNGVNVADLGATISAIQETPTIADFRFAADNRWLGGGHNRTEITGFSGAGAEQSTMSRSCWTTTSRRCS